MRINISVETNEILDKMPLDEIAKYVEEKKNCFILPKDQQVLSNVVASMIIDGKLSLELIAGKVLVNKMMSEVKKA